MQAQRILSIHCCRGLTLSLLSLFSLPLCLAAVSFLQVMSLAAAAAHSELRMIFCNGRLFHVFIPSCSSFACRCSPPSYLRMAPFTCRFPLMTTHSAIIEMRVVKKKCESLLFPHPAKKADLAIVTISKNSQPQHILISFMPLYRTGRLRLLASYSMLM